MVTVMVGAENIKKLRDLVKKMERAFGEENVVTLMTLNELGIMLEVNGEYEEAKEVVFGGEDEDARGRSQVDVGDIE